MKIIVLGGKKLYMNDYLQKDIFSQIILIFKFSHNGIKHWFIE
jgi:hypothetical protein